jgi:hypothetical protein
MVLIQSDVMIRFRSFSTALTDLHSESVERREIVRHGAEAKDSQYRSCYVAQHKAVYMAYDLYELQLELLWIKLVYLLLRVELPRYEGCHGVV